jgi:hypothetical protein
LWVAALLRFGGSSLSGAAPVNAPAAEADKVRSAADGEPRRVP